MSFISTLSAGSYKGYQSSSLTNNIIFSISANSNFPVYCYLSGDGNYFAKINGSDLDIYNKDNETYNFQQNITSAGVTGGIFSFNYSGNKFVYGKLGNSAVVYSRSGNTWSLEQTLIPSDPISNGFATSVTMDNSGNNILIGDADFSLGSTDPGNVYYFSYSSNTWTQQQKFVSNTAANSYRFGGNLDISNDGNIAIISALGNTTVTGALYFYTRSGNTWSEQQKINGKPLDVGISGNGTYAFATYGTSNTGTIVTYSYTNTWASLNTLSKPANSIVGGACINESGNVIYAGYWDVGSLDARVTEFKLNGTYVQSDEIIMPEGKDVMLVHNCNDIGNLVAINYYNTNPKYWSILEII